MTIRTRKFIGMLALIALLTGYSIVVMRIGADVLDSTNAFVSLVFYVIAGLAWIVPAGYIIAWMQRPD